VTELDHELADQVHPISPLVRDHDSQALLTRICPLGTLHVTAQSSRIPDGFSPGAATASLAGPGEESNTGLRPKTTALTVGAELRRPASVT
jgi:hypothetical protein